MCQQSAKKTRNDQLKHFIAAYDAVPYIMGTCHLDMAIFFLFFLFILRSTAI